MLNKAAHNQFKQSPTKKRSWQRRWQYFCRRIRRMQSSPEELSRGLAVGVFWGCFPFFGAQIVLSVAVATLIRGNKFMAALGTWISNPLTYGPIFLFNFHVGRICLKQWVRTDISFSFQSDQNLAHLGSKVLIILLTGCFLVGSLSSLLTYVGGTWFFRRMQAQRRKQIQQWR